MRLLTATPVGDDDSARASGRVDVHVTVGLGSRCSAWRRSPSPPARCGSRPPIATCRARRSGPTTSARTGDAGRAVVGEQVLEILERRRRTATVVLRCGFAGRMEHADRPAHLVEAVTADALGVGECGVRLVGVATQQMTGRGELQHHDRERVAEHVVHIARDALPLVERGLIGDQGTRRWPARLEQDGTDSRARRYPNRTPKPTIQYCQPQSVPSSAAKMPGTATAPSPHTSTIRRRGSFSAKMRERDARRRTSRPRSATSGMFSTVTETQATANGAHAGHRGTAAVHEIGTNGRRR